MSQVIFKSRLSESAGRLEHVWEHTVGSGHAALALRADWQQQLKQCHDELGFEHVRFHGLLSDDMGALVRENGQLIYSFHNIDVIFDYLLSIGMRPFVELSFMPTALASGHQTVFHYQANITPPVDDKDWAVLIHNLASHWVKRYGVTEVRKWYFEVWNEPNLKAFWPSTQARYFKLYKATAQAIKKVDSKLRVGGPATAKNQWIEDFVTYTSHHHLPADFISTHHYPTDALGDDAQNTEKELAGSRRSILRQWAQDTARRAEHLPVFYTEWNASSNPHDARHDQPYTAPVVIRTMLQAQNLVKGYSYWTFSDIFSENYFPSLPFSGGFGLLTLQGVPKPAYRAFELLHSLGDELLLVDGIHWTVDCWVIKNGQSLDILLTNHALPEHPIVEESVVIELACTRRPREVHVRRIDDDHANPRAAWEKMGRPDYPDQAQIDKLKSASQMIRQTLDWSFETATLRIRLRLPPHGAAGIHLDF
jgi:xylan 1,4-beta-xylosidase